MNFVNISELDDLLVIEMSVGSTVSAQPAQDLVRLKHQLEMMRFLVQKVITPVLVAFGIIGNIVNIAVLTRRWMKSSTNCYLTALAVYDVLYLALAFILSLHHYDSINFREWYVHLKAPIVRPLTDTCSNTGVWLTLTFTVERYIGVCHPMKGKVWCTPRRAKVIVVVVCLSAALVTFPEFFEMEATYTVDTSTNSTQLKAGQTELSRSQGYALGYKYINQALFTFLPLALLSIFNALLVNAVISAARWRQKMGSSDKCASSSSSSSRDRHPPTQQRITVMLIIVVVVFLLCQTPQAVQHVYGTYLEVTESMDEEKRVLFMITANVFNLLVVANCCSNFILYSSFSSKFRMTFHKLFCGPCMTRRNRANMEQLYSEPAVSALPLTPRKDGRVDTIVCNELWRNNLRDDSTPANEVTTRVAIQLANEMANFGSASDVQFSRPGVKNQRKLRDQVQITPKYL